MECVRSSCNCRSVWYLGTRCIANKMIYPNTHRFTSQVQMKCPRTITASASWPPGCNLKYHVQSYRAPNPEASGRNANQLVQELHKLLCIIIAQIIRSFHYDQTCFKHQCSPRFYLVRSCLLSISYVMQHNAPENSSRSPSFQVF